MPDIFDNINAHLLPALRTVLATAHRLDVAVGYFNLRGWDSLAPAVASFSGADAGCCRLIVGMQRPPDEVMRAAQRVPRDGAGYLDGPTVARLRRAAAQSFKEQIEFGVPSATAEGTLRTLAAQLQAKQVRVKLYVRHLLHAKLYLVQRSDPVTPLIGFVGSSNLTFSGLQGQGELNVNVVEQDAATKLQQWFNDRWNDPLAFDISAELADLIATSWASERLVSPYHVYLKMAYHLSEEAREGSRAFPVPPILRDVLLPFQVEAVSLAARYLQRRGGVLLADVVGLGKTLMATAIARIFQDIENSNTLVLCPPKLAEMWRWYVAHYQLTGMVVSLGQVTELLPTLPRYRLVIIDESHNLRNREGKRYAAVREYIERNEARTLLLTATPYNKQFLDLSNQLRLFLDDQRDLRVRPEHYFQALAAQGKTEADFQAAVQASPRSLRAFEQSPFPDDWRDLMRLFMVRRTRQFIMRTYATYDAERQRYFVMLKQTPHYFPLRQPRTLRFALDEHDPDDQYARLYHPTVVQVIEQLALPRYELAAYVHATKRRTAPPADREQLDNLARAGRRLIGFSRTNLFKRLESSGESFLRSLERHILRNMVTLHALEHGAPVPIGTQDLALLDTAISDVDDETPASDEETEQAAAEAQTLDTNLPDAEDTSLTAYAAQAVTVYATYRTSFRKRFKWLDAAYFTVGLKKALKTDALALAEIVRRVGHWHPGRDTKLAELVRLMTQTHAHDKLLIFTQFADTAVYLGAQVQRLGVRDLAVATGQSSDPTALARRFSPTSNGGLRNGETALRVLIATDVLGEGQNLQDAHVVVNYDLPWAIIRLIQRAGRVDRIGQRADTIAAYSFVPADGVERIIQLRRRLFERLQTNQEVVGTDETFFGEASASKLRDLYTEQASVLEDDGDEEVDLASAALQVWNSARESDRKAAQALALISAAARPLDGGTGPTLPPGVVSYLRFPDSTDAMVRVDSQGQVVSQSIAATFRAVACGPDTLALPKAATHHDLVAAGLQAVLQEQSTFGGQLGSLRSTRRQVYAALKRCLEAHQRHPTLFSAPYLAEVPAVLEALLRFPLRESARTALRHQLQLGASDDDLAENARRMHQDAQLVVVTDTEDAVVPDPQIVCSLGLREEPIADSR